MYKPSIYSLRVPYILKDEKNMNKAYKKPTKVQSICAILGISGSWGRQDDSYPRESCLTLHGKTPLTSN